MDKGHAWTEKELKKLERKIARVYGQAAREIQVKLDKYLNDFAVKDKIKLQKLDAGEITEKEYLEWRTGQIMMGKRWQELENNIAQDMHNANKITASMTKEFSYEAYAMNFNFGTFEVESGSGIDTAFTLYDRHTVERLVRDNPDLLPAPSARVKKKVAEGKDVLWNKRQVQSIMTQSILQGETIPEIAKRMRKGLGESYSIEDIKNRDKKTAEEVAQELARKNKNAAIRNARTMTTGAENAGRVDSYIRAEEMGIKMVQVWLSAHDARTRHEHRQLDGQKVEVGKPFKIDGYTIRFPGDPKAAPEMVYNCRCTLIGQVDGIDYDIAETYKDVKLDKHSLTTMSYNKWRNEHSTATEEYQLNSVSAQTFHDAIVNAKQTQPLKNRWRVTVHSVEDYAHDNLFMTAGGSTIAVTPSGDIVSVCKASGDISGSDLLAKSIEMGGTKLDSYGGNHRFYTKNGFEPISWCEWDDQWAPEEWLELNASEKTREPIIFYKYTGRSVMQNSADEFTSIVPPSVDYDTAYAVRDRLIG